MRCPKCNSVTAVSHSNRQGDAQYRKRYCTSLECRHAFSTWETTVNPATAGKQKLTRDEIAKRKRAYMKRVRAADPEKHKANVKRWKARRLARAEAAATGEDVETIYARWGVV